MTVNNLIETSKTNRYFVTKAIRLAGLELNRGRKPTVFTPEQARKIKAVLRKILAVKTLLIV